MKSRVLAVLIFGLASLPVYAQVSVTTSRNDNLRDGQNLNETILTPANVNVGQFGKLFSQPVDGYVYAQPLYVPNVSIAGLGTHNVLYVATEHDSVYAFDADNNTGLNASPLWQASFINPARGITTVSSSDVSCSDLVPEIGITSTPVIDTVAGTMFMVTKIKDNGQFAQVLHAIDITTGKDQPGSPVVINAQVKGTGQGAVNGVVKFDPLHEAQRPGLLLVNGTLFIAWASHCDNQPYHGWVMEYNESSLKQVKVWNSTPNGGLGGVWQSGGGVASDGTYIFFATGNGSYDGPKGGDDFADSVLKGPATSQLPLHPYDYFTPYDQGTLSGEDADVGSGGVLLLPDQGQGAPHRYLLVEVGKSGSIYLIDRNHMGGFNSQNNSQIVQDMENAIGGLWSTPAWWNNNVYFGGSNDYLRQYTFNPSTGLLSNGAVATGTYSGFPGPTPSISADGTGNAIVWTVQVDNYRGSGQAILHAYDATDIGTELYNSNQDSSRDQPGVSVKFTVPTIVNGKVYVPTSTQVSVYGLLGNR
jgi:hypothetical protein